MSSRCYHLSCSQCHLVFESTLTEAEFFSDKYLQGDEPLWCATCEEYVFPQIYFIELKTC